MLISIIIPVFDRRSTEWKTLESALAQSLERTQYEIVTVVGVTPHKDPHFLRLLQCCDTVVPIDADSDNAASEIHFYIAGQRAAKGDVLFFVEGHTELLPDCCANIAAYFRRAPRFGRCLGAENQPQPDSSRGHHRADQSSGGDGRPESGLVFAGRELRDHDFAVRAAGRLRPWIFSGQRKCAFRAHPAAADSIRKD